MPRCSKQCTSVWLKRLHRQSGIRSGAKLTVIGAVVRTSLERAGRVHHLRKTSGWPQSITLSRAGQQEYGSIISGPDCACLLDDCPLPATMKLGSGVVRIVDGV
jgi:hypothetical protein